MGRDGISRMEYWGKGKDGIVDVADIRTMEPPLEIHWKCKTTREKGERWYIGQPRQVTEGKVSVYNSSLTEVQTLQKDIKQIFAHAGLGMDCSPIFARLFRRERLYPNWAKTKADVGRPKELTKKNNTLNEPHDIWSMDPAFMDPDKMKVRRSKKNLLIYYGQAKQAAESKMSV